MSIKHTVVFSCSTARLRFFGYLGLIASICVGTGEFLLHFSPHIHPEPYGFFLDVSETRLHIGHFLMVAFIPLYIPGYWFVFLALRPGNKTLAGAVLLTAVFSFVIGGIWAGSRADLGMLIKTGAGMADKTQTKELLTAYKLHMESLVWVLRILITLLSVLFSVTVLRGGTLFAKWIGIAPPFVWLVLIFGSYFLIPAVGIYLVPAAMNVAHLLFFSSCLFALKSGD